MKKRHIVLIVIASVIAFAIIAPIIFFYGSIFSDFMNITNADIEIDSYRLCKDEDGEDIIIIKYLLKNNGKEPTALAWEGDFNVYQNGVSLTECTEIIPKKYNYDSEDQYKNIKGGVEYYAEIAYELDSPDDDVEVEVEEYDFFEKKKEKVFKLK